MKDSLWSVDLFRCESIKLKSHWVMVVMDQFTRRLIGYGIALCCMFNKAISGMGIPKYLNTDHDPLFEYHRWKANLRILDVEEIKAVPYTPISHPFVERLIGTLRREFLDHVLFWNIRDLDRKLEEFRDFYNGHRVHASLDGDTPSEISGAAVISRADLHQFCWRTHCRGLFQLPIAA
jgi:putative transposase